MMVAVTISMILLTGVVSLVTNSSQSHRELRKMSQQMDNGRYASQFLEAEIQHAGFYGQLYQFGATPGTLPDPCLTSITALEDAVPLAVQGYDNVTTPVISCLTDAEHLDGTDILVIRRAATDIVPLDDPAIVASDDLSDYSSAAIFIQTTPDEYVIDTSNSELDLINKDFDAADIRRYRVDIYYISAGDIPVLKRLTLTSGGMVTESLVDGIIDMQVEYAFDTDSSGDINPDGAGNYYQTAPAAAATWDDIVGVRLHFLSRNLNPTQGYTDNKDYILGLKSDGTTNIYSPGNNFKHHVYTTTTRVINVAGRKDNPAWY